MCPSVLYDVYDMLTVLLRYTLDCSWVMVGLIRSRQHYSLGCIGDPIAGFTRLC